jgi:hypothetical protein
MNEKGVYIAAIGFSKRVVPLSILIAPKSNKKIRERCTKKLAIAIIRIIRSLFLRVSSDSNV